MEMELGLTVQATKGTGYDESPVWIKVTVRKNLDEVGEDVTRAELRESVEDDLFLSMDEFLESLVDLGVINK